MRIGIDLDDVCVDFIGMLIDRYNYRFHYGDLEAKVLREDVTSWDLLEVLDFDSRDALWAWVERDCLEHWARAPAVQGAIDGLKDLRDAGHDLVIITSKAQGWEWVAHAWLGSHRVPAREVHITDDKAAVPACDVYVDDRPKNLREIKEAHPDAVVVKFLRPHNVNEPVEGTDSVSSWSEFLDLVKIHVWSTDFERPDETTDPQESLLVQAAERQHQAVLGDRTSVFEQPRKEWVTDDAEIRVTSETGGQKGQKLARLGALDPVALIELAKVSGFGAQKYDAFNFLKGYDWSLSFDALERHLLWFWAGEDRDPESGRLHVAHAAWHCAALTSFVLRGLGTDDRFKG